MVSLIAVKYFVIFYQLLGTHCSSVAMLEVAN